MRTMLLTAGLCLATTAASASDYTNVDRASANLTLTNGCVYMPSPSGRANTWSLIYKRGGATAQCALKVIAQTTRVPTVAKAPAREAQVSQARTSALSYVQTSRVPSEPQYLVGVFR